MDMVRRRGTPLLDLALTAAAVIAAAIAASGLMPTPAQAQAPFELASPDRLRPSG